MLARRPCQMNCSRTCVLGAFESNAQSKLMDESMLRTPNAWFGMYLNMQQWNSREARCDG